jgi:DNA-directed RNA polymerase alpha subunit
MEVTSMAIRPVFEQVKSEEEEVRPVLPVQFYSGINKEEKIGIPIVKLAKNQEIRMRFEVQKGIGKMHSKWSPVSLSAFTPDPEIRLDETIELTNIQKVNIRDSCPTRVFEVHEGVFQVVNPDKCIFCGECKKMAEHLDMLHLKNFIRIGTFSPIQAKRRIVIFSRSNLWVRCPL